MKKLHLMTLSLLAMLTFNSGLKAQEWNAGLDIYSSYLWRGTKFGKGPAFQPSVDFTYKGFNIGVWGSICSSEDEAAEMDLFATYAFSLGEKSSLTFTVTDYYFPGSDNSAYFSNEAHYFEPLVSLGLGKFKITSAYMANAEAIYIEAGYAAGPVNLTVAAGDGIYTIDGEFNFCNIGIGTSKEIKLTENFSLPVSGAIVLNPSSEKLFVTVGISL